MSGRTTPAKTPVDLDLDKRRSEANKQPKTIRFGGKVWKLPAELPVEVTEHLVAGRFASSARALLGDKQATELLAIRPPLSIEDVSAMVDVYDVNPGESSASTDS